MTDFRALCEELVDDLQAYADADLPVDGEALAKTELLVNRARAALAETKLQPVAEESSVAEPAALAEQPVRPTDEELASVYHDCCGGCEFMDQGGFEDATRAVLAQWGRPAAAPVPETGEVAQVAIELQELAESCDTLAMGRVQRLLTRAATLLQQQAAPTPIPMDKLDRLIALDRDDPTGGSHD